MTTRISQANLAIIADDEDTGRTLLAEAANQIGLVALEYANGLDALESALAREVTIVLLDVDMPQLDGYEVCRRLRRNPRFETIPIVIVTGHDDSDAIMRAFEAGATDFIAKPVNWALLPRRLAYILRNATATRALEERVVQVHTLVDALPDTLWVVTQDGEVRWAPQADAAATQAAMNVPAALMPNVQAAIRHTAVDGKQRTIDYRAPRADGQPATYELRFSRREAGDVVILRRDTTERSAAAERIERLAYFDALTGLPNRQRCMDTAQRFLQDAARAREQVAIACMDPKILKRVNDSFGHSMGDAVLRAVAERLLAAVEPLQAETRDVLISRFEGDQFVLALRHPAAGTLALRIADACIDAFKQPIVHDSLEFYCSPSIGLAQFPDDATDLSTLLKHADTAMYSANASGVAIAAYVPAMSSRMRDWLDLEARLRRAVHNDSLRVVYQPKFRIRDQRLVGVEALMRWTDAERGEISPSRFIEIAEDSGLILDMSGWLMRAVCRQLRTWLDRGIKVPVAINCSGKELLHGDPAGVLEAEAAAAGVPTSLIEIELTESILIKDATAVQNTLKRFRELGCRIALDDFGTGYSSLAYITRFPPDRIKIDRAFVRDIDQSARDGAIAKAILSLAESLDITVTAEGVERQGQLEWLRARDCHEVQGFLYARPMTAADLEAQFLIGAHPAAEARIVSAN